MIKQTDKNLFILPSMSRLYQRLLNGVADYHKLGNLIIREIQAAQSFRQLDRTRQLSELLNNIPVKEYQTIAAYYLIWCDGRLAKYDTKRLEVIIEQTDTYKTKAMLSLAAFEGYQGRVEASLYHYTEASKTSPSISDYIVLSRSIAALKSAEGFHEAALEDLEKLVPIIKHAEPQAYYDFLNSYAVELSAAGRLQEAGSVSFALAASPFISYYPEFRETVSEVNQRVSKRRSTVAINLPSPEPDEIQPTAKVIQFPVKRTTQDAPAKDEQAEEGFTPLKLLRLILKSVLKEQVTEEQVEKICSTFHSTLQDWWAEEQE